MLPEKKTFQKTSERNDSSTCFPKQLQQRNTIIWNLGTELYFKSVSFIATFLPWALRIDSCRLHDAFIRGKVHELSKKRRCSFYTPKFEHVLTQKYNAKSVCSTKPFFLRLFYFELVLDTLIVSNVCWKLKENPQGQWVRLERCD